MFNCAHRICCPENEGVHGTTLRLGDVGDTPARCHQIFRMVSKFIFLLSEILYLQVDFRNCAPHGSSNWDLSNRIAKRESALLSQQNLR